MCKGSKKSDVVIQIIGVKLPPVLFRISSIFRRNFSDMKTPYRK